VPTSEARLETVCTWTEAYQLLLLWPGRYIDAAHRGGDAKVAVSNTGADTTISYITEIEHVKEIMLVGTADLRFWTDHLKNEDLVPYDDNGTAQLAITGTQLRWMGVGFRELTISVAVSSCEDGRLHDGYILVHAYNSVALLAWIERVMFHTPYYHGMIEVEARVPASIQLRKGQDTVFHAGMSERMPSAEQIDTPWAGPIFLPRRTTISRGMGEFFFARLAGPVEIYPFDPTSDTLVLPSSHDSVWDWLRESDFTGREWRIRKNATHAKSKTYQRPPIRK
jgi:hypothetical protein